MRIVYWCINSCVVNSWLLYRRDLKNTYGDKVKHMPLINFQLDIANELLNASQTVLSRKRGRPSSLLVTMDSASLSPSLPSTPSSSSLSGSSKRAYIPEPAKSLRFDNLGHWVEWGEKDRCRLCRTGFSRSKCSKCNINLCCNPSIVSMVSFHT